jgi:hypothetical protein
MSTRGEHSGSGAANDQCFPSAPPGALGAEARGLIAEGMAIAGFTDDDLEKLHGSDPRKVAVARVVWERTTVGMPWLAEHLNLRSAVNAKR